MLALLYKNMISFFKNHKLIALIFIIVQIISILATMYIYALINGNMEQTKIASNSLKRFTVNFSAPLNEDPKAKLRYIAEKSIDGISSISLFSDKNSLQADYLYNNVDLYKGEYFSKSAFNNGYKEIILSNSCIQSGDTSVGSTYVKNGEKYRIVGKILSSYDVVPLTSLSKTPGYNSMIVVMQSIPSKDSVNMMNKIIRESFPEASIEAPVINNDSTQYLLQFILAVSVFFLAIVNIAYLYNYILSTRTKQVKIMRICGYTKRKSILIFTLEILIISSAAFALCSFISIILLPSLISFITDDKYKYVMTIKNYINLYAGFMIVILLMFIMTINNFIKKSLISI